MSKVYLMMGIIAPLSYVMAVVVGGRLVQGYNHFYNSISELTASNIPKNPVISILFFIYNLSLAIFGLGISAYQESSNGPLTKIASVMIIIVGILGISMLYYVQDPRHEPMSLKGKLHIILAGISSVLTMVIMVLMGFSFWNISQMKNYAIYSFISFGILFISGGIAAISVSKDSYYGGLFERLTIGSFMQWVLVISIVLLT